uniref:D-xylose reductase [NAD(P)H] n=1 Tax=Paecilomyces divaricatus TaxID=644132 RepID=A0A3G1IHI3_PAEDI|nr:putative aldo/keto reductase [Paecilomyces divaricatus]
MSHKLSLNDGVLMPTLAFGVGTAFLKRSGSDALHRPTVDAVKEALRVGYRHLDTAEMYNTELEVGAAIHESIAEGIVQGRDELFITTKVSSDFLNISKSIDVSLQKLKLDYVDAYLIHTPYWAESDDDLQKAWKGMEEVKASGKARTIGVSNFQSTHLRTVLATAQTPPSVNQLEFHPYLSVRDGNDYLFSLRDNMRDITISAYGALAPITRNIPGPLDETLKEVANRYGVGTDLVCLRWCIEQGVATITTSRHEDRMKGYLRVFDFQITPDEVMQIGASAQACLGDKEQPLTRIEKYHMAQKHT